MQENVLVLCEYPPAQYFKLDRVIGGDYVGDWCRLPYPRHPLGCPNFGQKKKCPPKSVKWTELIQEPYYFVIHEFDLEVWVNKHRNRNYFLYQTGARKILKDFCREVIGIEEMLEPTILMQPEKNYVNVFSTCRIHGVKLEKNPQKIVKFVAMIGTKRNAVNVGEYFA